MFSSSTHSSPTGLLVCIEMQTTGKRKDPARKGHRKVTVCKDIPLTTVCKYERLSEKRGKGKRKWRETELVATCCLEAERATRYGGRKDAEPAAHFNSTGRDGSHFKLLLDLNQHAFCFLPTLFLIQLWCHMLCHRHDDESLKVSVIFLSVEIKINQ